jgi:DNA polymerase III alpha subunit
MLNNFTTYDLPKFGYIKIPKFTIPDEDRKNLNLSSKCNSEEYLLALAKDGFNKKLESGKIPKDKKHTYWERISNELEEINKLLFTDYILLVYHIIKFCDKNGILNSPGRGSCGGSLLLYVLGVVKIDALKHNLLFERFIAGGRTEIKEINGEKYIKSENLPDVDLDSDRELKYKINEFITSQFPNRTCQIKTVGTLQGKSVIKEVLKCYEEYNEEDAKEISDLIETRFGKVEQITNAISDDPEKENKKFKEWAKNHLDTVKISCQLNTLIKNTSVHASGIILCEEELNNSIPLELSSTREPVISYDMEGAQCFGVKLDNLGLKNLTSIKECLGLVNKKMEDIDVNDESIYIFLRNSDDYRGIFQAEEGLGKMVMRKLQCKNIDDIGMSISIGRPGSMKFLDEIINARDGAEIRKIDDRVKDILSPTYNVIIYQEQIMALARRMANFTSQESDGLRKCVSGDTTFISKTRGIISIHSLIKNGFKDDLFLVMDDRGRQLWKPIKNIWLSGNKVVKRVTTRNGLNIKTTGEHQFLTNDWWKARKYLDINNDYLVCAKEIEYDGEDKISVDMAIVIAGLLTEGFFTETGQTFTNFNKFVIDIFCQSFFNEFGKYPSLSKDGHVARIDKESKEIIHKYLSYGKSGQKFIPEIMMGMTKETTRKFLSFMLTCEGGCIEQGKFEISSKSITMANQIKLLLLRFGVRSCFFSKINPKYGEFYYINIGERDSLERLVSELSVLLEPDKLKKLNLYIKNKIGNCTLDIIPNNITQKFIKQYTAGKDVDRSGSLYKSTVSRDRFYELVSWTNDQYWIDIATGKQEYSSIKDIYRSYPDMEDVYDFTIDEETPFIIANGIVIHNCIGKKLKDKIVEHKERFIENSLKNKYEEEFVLDMWQTFEMSGDYLFNKSHGYQYGYLSAICAYLKANYPTEYFYSLLKNAKNESKPQEEISLITEELSRFGVKLLGPHIIKSDVDFKIEDKNNVRMGLGNVKGIADKSLEKLKNFCHAYSNKFEIFLAANECGIGIGILGNLILAGTMDDYLTETRTQTCLEMQTWNLLTEREQKRVLQLGEEYKYHLINIIKYLSVPQDSSDKPFIKESRLETIRRDFKPYNKIHKQNSQNEELCRFWFEKSLLGFSYSHNLVDILRKEYNDIVSIEAAMAEIDDEKVTIGGEIIEIRSGTSKNKNKYIKCLITDGNKSVNVMIMERYFESNNEKNKNHKLEIGDIVVATGQKKPDIVFCDQIVTQNIKIISRISDLPKEKLENFVGR